MISRKYKFYVRKRKIADFFQPSQEFVLARSNAKSHSFFTWVVMFNLTIFGSEKQYFPFRNREILLILEDELFVELSTTSYLTDAFCLSGTALVPFAHSNITRSSAGQKNVRK